ncbi:WD40 repeat domain-containing protein [Nonomuraea sp. NPDC049141]|uniref:WD40 repeat domain-containing protein n=1 Tax=Nonomuraea sp. NPDC049141 TaxID=3155500 RepID=UPI0033DF82B0
MDHGKDSARLTWTPSQITISLYAAIVINSLLLRGALSVSLLLSTVTTAPASAQQLIGADIDVPDAGVVLHEQDGDPWRVTAFSKEVSSSRRAAYLRSSDGNTFMARKGYGELQPAPKGGKVAGVPYSSPGAYNSVVIFDSAGRAKRIRTVRKPLNTTRPIWTRDGRKLVLSIQKDGIETVGFVIVDPVTGTSKAVTVRSVHEYATFQWTPDGKYLVAGISDPYAGVRVYRQDGHTVRTLRKIGIMHGTDSFSPSGKRLLTLCVYTENRFCLWDFKTGKLVKHVNENGPAIGWWDDQHLSVEVSDDNGSRAVVIDLNGEITRVLASFTAKAKREWVDLVYTPSHSPA